MKYGRDKLKKAAKIAVLIMIALLTSVPALSCTDKKSTEVWDFDPEINAPDQYMDDDIWYCNRFRSVGEPPFSLPDDAEYDSFLSGLKTAGFSVREMKYSDFAFRDDCMVFSRYDEEDGKVSVSWFQKSPYAPESGISYENSQTLQPLYYKDSLSEIPIHPIDITPEGFYERSGGQIFAFPYYSYDVFKSDGQESAMLEDNEYYSCIVCCVRGTDVFELTMECVAVCDIDGDGNADVLTLSYGPTSGLFTVDVTCLTSRGLFDTIFNMQHGVIGFCSRDGKPVIESVGYDSIHHYYDIVLEEAYGETIVMLYNNGEPGEIWGAPNSRNRILSK